MESPCVNVCLIDKATGYCTGCKRTLAEIAGWSRLTDAERRRIMGLLPHRGRPAATAPRAAAPGPGQGD